jgi:hypothetical protein
MRKTKQEGVSKFSPISQYLRANGWTKEADSFDAEYIPQLESNGIGFPIRFGCPTNFTTSVCHLNMVYANGVDLGIAFPHDGYISGCAVRRKLQSRYGGSGEYESCSQLTPELAARILALAIFIADANVPDKDRKERDP